MLISHPASIAGGFSRLLSGMRSPDFHSDSVQVLKGAMAATAGWWLSVNVLHSTMPFMAPWTALLTVHATVYRSLSRGLQTMITTGLGVALSFLVGSYLGVSVWTFALALLIGLAASYVVWIRDEGVAIATTAIFILGSGFKAEAPLLDDRLLEVGLGVAIGIVVNLVVVPPLRGQQAPIQVDGLDRRIGDVLLNIADETAISWRSDRTESWIEETVSIDDELRTAWQTVGLARESQRVNPRTRLTQRRKAERDVDYETMLDRLAEATSDIRYLARTLRGATYDEDDWGDEFRTRWAAIVADTGRSLKDPDIHVEDISDQLDELATDFSEDGLSHRNWTIYGTLINSMRQISVTVIDDVASAHHGRHATNPLTPT